MRRRAIVLFWGAAAASVLFLGAAWSSAAHLGPGPNAFANRLVLFVALIGFAGTTLVAGRIAFVVGRAQRHARRGGAGKGRFRRETGKRSEIGTAGDLVDEAVEVGPHVPPGANGVPSVGRMAVVGPKRWVQRHAGGKLATYRNWRV
jgi:hypothetical protein